MSKILDTIRKLLTLANDKGATEGETQAALGRVAALAAKHSISDVEIQKAYRADGSEGVTIKIRQGDLDDEILHEARSLPRWHKGIAMAIADATSTGVYTSHAFGHRVLRVYGLPTDIAVAHELFKFAVSAMSQQARRFCKGLGVQGSSIQGRTYRDGWVAGLRDAAEADLQARNADKGTKAEITCGTGTALVIVSDVTKEKSNALSIFADAKHLTSRKGRRVTSAGAEVYGAGRAAGRATNLSRNTIH